MTREEFCKRLMKTGCTECLAEAIADKRPEGDSYKSYLAQITRVAARMFWVRLIKLNHRRSSMYISESLKPCPCCGHTVIEAGIYSSSDGYQRRDWVVRVPLEVCG